MDEKVKEALKDHPDAVEYLNQEDDAARLDYLKSILDNSIAEEMIDEQHGFDFQEWNSIHQLLVQCQHGMMAERDKIGLSDLKKRTQLNLFIDQVTSAITKVAYWGNKAMAEHNAKIQEAIKDIQTPIMPIVRK